MNTSKNTTAKKAMKAAWTNWKAGRYTSWSKCLTAAWAWAKQAVAAVVRVYVTTSYKQTEKAINVDGVWYPKSQVELEWGNFGLDAIYVPTWLYNKK